MIQSGKRQSGGTNERLPVNQSMRSWLKYNKLLYLLQADLEQVVSVTVISIDDSNSKFQFTVNIY